MSRRRHDDDNRVTPDTPTKVRCHVEWLRRQATRRKLLLLECAIIRHAPFAECGRTLWELLPEQTWFNQSVPPADAIREALRRWEGETGRTHDYCPVSYLGYDNRTKCLRTELPPDAFSPLDGRRAVQLLEQAADGHEDALTLAQEYVHLAEYRAEADVFQDQHASAEVPLDRPAKPYPNYGVADWLYGLRTFGLRSWNVLDYYLASYPCEYYSYASWLPLHPKHREVALGLIDDLLGQPLRSMRFDPMWRTSTVVALAGGMFETGDFSPIPILADALEDTRCDNENLLRHCRADQLHARGCWVVDRVLGKESA